MPGAPLEQLVSEKYPLPQWALVRELRQGTGYGDGREGRIDVAAFNCWPSKGNLRLAFECKRTRADFRREMENPKKRAWVEEQFHQTFFVCSHGIVKEDEVPDGWGLLVATKKGDKLIQRKMARHREIGVFSEALALSAIRTLTGKLSEAMAHAVFLDGNEVSREKIQEEVFRQTSREREKLKELSRKLRKKEFELIDDRSMLMGPWESLMWHAGRSSVLASERAKGLTSQDVKQIVSDIRVGIVRQLQRQISATNISLTSLLAEIEKVDKPR